MSIRSIVDRARPVSRWSSIFENPAWYAVRTISSFRFRMIRASATSPLPAMTAAAISNTSMYGILH